MKWEKLKFRIWRPLGCPSCNLEKCCPCWTMYKSPGMEHHRGWESCLWHGLPVLLWYALKESSCLGMQLKMGGKCHLKLNIGERPIANKYREGKMKRTLERELNSTWNCWKGNAWSQSRWLGISSAFAGCTFLSMGQHQFWPLDKVAGNVASFWMCYSLVMHTVVGIEEFSTPPGRVSTTFVLRMLA